MREAAVALLLSLGTFFAVVAAVGVVRFPDLYMRLSATTKAATLGVSFLSGGVALFFGDATVTGKAAAIIVFLLLTAPVAAHMLSRAAYFSGVPLWQQTVQDDLAASGDACEQCALFLPSDEEPPQGRGDAQGDTDEADRTHEDRKAAARVRGGRGRIGSRPRPRRDRP